jgi:hypothetical protein
VVLFSRKLGISGGGKAFLRKDYFPFLKLFHTFSKPVCDIPIFAPKKSKCHYWLKTTK